jgi:hypothetical protein
MFAEGKPLDRGGGVGHAVGPVVADELGRQTAGAFHRRLVQQGGHPVHLFLLGGELLLQLVDLLLEAAVLFQRRVVDLLTFRDPFLNRFGHGAIPPYRRTFCLSLL